MSKFKDNFSSESFYPDSNYYLDQDNTTPKEDSISEDQKSNMGKKTWLLLQKIPDWRWGLKGSHTFWYENMEIFRQVERNNWREVMIRVSIRLNNFLNN